MTKTMTAIALVFGLGIAAAPAGASAQQSGQATATPAPAENPNAIKSHMPKLSHDAGKPILELQKAVDSKDAAAISTALAAANAAATTADDHYVIGLLQLKAAAAANDKAALANAIEVMLASGSVAEDEKYGLYFNLAQMYDALNQDARAAQAYQQALQANPSSIDATAGLAESLAAQGQTTKAVDLLEKGIALQSANGAKAPQAWYKRALSIAFKAHLPSSVNLSREWVAAYPTTDAWQNALAIYQNLTNLDESQTLDLMRLKRATGVLTGADYFNYGDIAVRKGFSGEAKSALDQGFAANTIDSKDPSFSQLYSLASEKTKGDRESLPSSPEASSNAHQVLVVGDAWYGYGDYAKAAEFYRAALTKSGVDKDVANLHLGMALARQGDKTGATAALNQVGGSSAELAKFWLLYVNTKA